MGENHGVIEQCTIAFADGIQKGIDDNIILNDRQSGDYSLFDTAHNTTNYSVAIGGIAGYSSNGVIIDSYSKVNAVKASAYIAGGILGYSEGYNYIGYTFTTGAVYGKYVTGGLVGYQLDSYDLETIDYNNDTNRNNLIMKNNISLTDWNYMTEAFDYRQEITSKLYNNQKVLYQHDGEYYNFYVKMPEIGNLSIVSGESELTSYVLNHDNYFVGSAVGMILTTQPQITPLHKEYNLVTNELLDSSYILDQDILNVRKLSETGKYIYTNTLGIYSEIGSASAGTREDSYFTTKFNYKLNNNSTIDLYSYRTAVSESNINNYSRIAIDPTKTNEYFDVFSYADGYGDSYQEYTQQILGTYTRTIEGTDTNTATLNLFRYDYHDEDKAARFTIRTQTSSSWFADNDSNTIWAIGKYLPTYNDGTYVSTMTITNEEQLQKAFSSNSSGIIYKIEPAAADYKLDLSELVNARGENINPLDTQNTIGYYNAIRDVFNGVVKEEEDGTKTKPTIILKVPQARLGEDVSKVNTIFSSLSGVQFNNLDIKIIYEVYNNSYKQYTNYGLLANTLQNANISNCDITFTIDNIPAGELLIGKPEGQTEFYYSAKNVGVLFGSISNSMLTNNTFNINLGIDIDLYSDIIENFGVLAGVIDNSTITGNTINISDIKVNLSNHNMIINVGMIAGGANHVTYSDNEIVKANFVVIDESKDTDQDLIKGNLATINAAVIFGTANNSNISNIELDKARLMYDINTANDDNTIKTVNLSLIAGMSYASMFDNINIYNNSEFGSKPLFYNVTDHTVTNLSIGAIIGRDDSSTMGSSSVVSSTADINVIGNISNLSVGGLVGIANRSDINKSYYNGYINVRNEALGSVDAEGVVLETVYTYVGGLIGTTSGVVRVSNCYTAGAINASNYVDDTTYESAIGGMIGKVTGAIDMSQFVSFMHFGLGYITGDDERSFNNIYVSGIIGLNKGLFTGNNGYSYVELPNKVKGVITSAITNNSVSSNTSNVFYAQEFVGNSYDKYDFKFKTFAMADIYQTINTYAQIYDLNSNFDTTDIGSIRVYIPKGLTYIESNVGAEGATRFNPKVLTPIEGGYVAVAESGYQVIVNDTTTQKFAIGTNNGIISGRTTAKGKVTINVNSIDNASSRSYAVVTNNGTISNIYFETTNLSTNKSGLNVVLTNSNNGLIIGVYVYGLTQSNYSIAMTNNGMIYQSATATVYSYAGGNADENTWPEIFGLVETNAETGVISDCYSSNFGITKKADVKTKVYGLAKDNHGAINNSMYYIPELVEYDNEVKSVVFENHKNEVTQKQGTTNNCSNGSLPGFINSRKSVWTIENDHAQIIGIKDIEGAIVIRATYGDIIDNKSIQSANEFKNSIADKLRNKNQVDSWYFDYELDFYVTPDKMPTYNVIKIETAKEFIDYINSLPAKRISGHTIVMIDSMMPLEINQKLNEFSIDASSMLVGVTWEDEDTHEFKDVVIKYTYSNSMPSALINHNDGILAGITFEGFKFYNENPNITGYAPILTNNGTIYNIAFNTVTISGGASKYVAGIVYFNGKTGIMNQCTIDQFTLHSRQFVNLICSRSLGKVYNCYSYNGLGVSGSSNNDGKDNAGDND